MPRRVGIALAALVVAVLVLWRTGALGGPDEGWRDDSPRELGSVIDPAAESTPPAAETSPTLVGTEGKPLAPHPAPAVVTGPRVTGRVVDPGGRGVAGARVLSIRDDNGTTFTLADAGKEGSPAFVATTDAEGRFTVPVSKAAPYHLLVADAQGFGLVAKGEVPTGGEVVLTLGPARAVWGTVKDGAGNAVAGARVRALLLVDTLMLEREGTSDATGAYRVDGLPAEVVTKPGGWAGYMEGAWCEVTAAGFAPLFVEHVLRGAVGREARRDFTLLRGAIVAGRVEDADSGEPLAGATVVLASREGLQGYSKQGGGHFMNPYGQRTLATTTSGADGAFRFERVPCKAVGAPDPPFGKQPLGGVTAWVDGFAAAGEGVDLVEEGTVVQVTLRLWPAAVVTGRVLNAAREPVEGASVGLTVEGRMFRGGAVPRDPALPTSWGNAGPDGRFHLRGAPASAKGPTEAKLSANPPLRRRSGPHPQPVTVAVTLEPGKTVDVGDVVLPAETAVPTTTVVVLKPDGTPFFGALVSRSGSFSEHTRTDAEGRVPFVWGKPREGQTLPPAPVLVRAKGFAPTPATLQPPGSGQDVVTVTLRPAQRIAGRVVHADGSPASALQVHVGDGTIPPEDLLPERGEPFQLLMDIPKGRSLPAVYAAVWTDTDGTFAAEDLPDGPYHVRATKPRRVPASGPPLSAWSRGVAAGTTDVLLRLPVDDSPATGALVGLVAEAGTGAPVKAVSVVVRRGDEMLAVVYGHGAGVPQPPGSSPSTLDAAGRLRIEGLPVGTVDVEATATGFRPSRARGVEVRADGAVDLGTLALDRGIAVVGRVQPPAGVTLKDHTLSFHDAATVPNPRYLTATLAADGSFRATGFEPGTFVAVAQAPGFGPTRPPILVPARGERLVVREGASEVRFDVEWAVAGILYVAPGDDRLPPAAWSGRVATQEQKRFGAATRVTVTGPDGTAVLDLTGVWREDLGPHGWLALLPGRYVARIEFPGGESREETVDLEAGKEVSVRFRRK